MSEERLAELEARMNKIERIMYGNGKLGIVARLEVVWRSYVWLIAAGSALGSSAITYLLVK